MSPTAYCAKGKHYPPRVIAFASEEGPRAGRNSCGIDILLDSHRKSLGIYADGSPLMYAGDLERVAEQSRFVTCPDHDAKITWKEQERLL